MQNQPADIRNVFGQNLRELSGDHGSVSGIAKEIGINRTQFNRYLYGEAFPRPDVLHRICSHFKVDARILTEPLENLRAEKLNDAAESASQLNMRLDPPDHNMLPDGLYIEWKPSWIHEGLFTRHLMQVSTQAKVRRTRIRVPASLTSSADTPRYQLPLIDYAGIAIAQNDGFALLDQGKGTSGVAMAAFRKGFQNADYYYPGYKLSAMVFNRLRHHFRGATVLEFLGGDRKKILGVARSSVWITAEELPVEIRKIMETIENEEMGIRACRPQP